MARRKELYLRPYIPLKAIQVESFGSYHSFKGVLMEITLLIIALIFTVYFICRGANPLHPLPVWMIYIIFVLCLVAVVIGVMADHYYPVF